MKNIDKITNYLLSGSQDVFILRKPQLKKKGRIKTLGSKKDSILDPLMNTGFADAAKINKAYLHLLETLKINDLSNRELVDELIENLDNIEQNEEENKESRRNCLENNETDESTKVMILKLRLHQKWSVNSLWAKFWITKEQLNAIFVEFK